MATNSSIKKSSIPRAVQETDRTDQASKSRLRVRGPKPPVSKPNPHCHQTHSKPSPHDGLLKEDDDAVRRSLLELEADHAKMKRTLEDTVQEAEERLAAMEKLMAERERLCAADMIAAAERTESLEQQVENYEKTLIENNIDPVTGAAVEPTSEQTTAVEKQKKVTKGEISKMREKLHEMDENSDKYLSDIQNMLQEIEQLEATSYRVCDTSQMENMPTKDLMALIHEVEEAQKKEEKEKKRQKKKEKGEEEGDTEDEEEEEEDEQGSPSPKQEEKENVQPPPKPEVFITQKNKN